MEVNQELSTEHSSVELQLELLKQMMLRAESQHPLLDDLAQVKQQNDILRAIRDQMMTNTKSITVESQETEASKTRVSTEGNSIIKRPTAGKETKARINTQGSEDVRVRRRLLNNTDINTYLVEIENKCSRQAFQVFSQLARQFGIQKEKLAQARKDELECQKLNKELTILRNQSMELRVKVKELETQLKAQESNMKQANKTLNEKERQLNKTETSLLVKDRLLNEQLKSLCARTEALKKLDQSQKVEREYLDKTWVEIVDQLEKRLPDAALNFKKAVLEKGKESLLRQRNVLQEEQEHLDKQHRYIEKIIVQLQGIAPKPPV